MGDDRSSSPRVDRRRASDHQGLSVLGYVTPGFIRVRTFNNNPSLMYFIWDSQAGGQHKMLVSAACSGFSRFELVKSSEKNT